MARKSVIDRNIKRLATVTRYKLKRENLKKIAYGFNIEDDVKMKAMDKFHNLPRDASLSRVIRRCLQCGRTHAVYRKFKLCRMCLRSALMTGQIPGGRKASW